MIVYKTSGNPGYFSEEEINLSFLPHCFFEILYLKQNRDVPLE